jgi:hypothetical protein
MCTFFSGSGQVRVVGVVGQGVKVRVLVRLLLEALRGGHVVHALVLLAGAHLQQRHEPWSVLVHDDDDDDDDDDDARADEQIHIMHACRLS